MRGDMTFEWFALFSRDLCGLGLNRCFKVLCSDDVEVTEVFKS